MSDDKEKVFILNYRRIYIIAVFLFLCGILLTYMGLTEPGNTRYPNSNLFGLILGILGIFGGLFLLLKSKISKIEIRGNELTVTKGNEDLLISDLKLSIKENKIKLNGKSGKREIIEIIDKNMIKDQWDEFKSYLTELSPDKIEENKGQVIDGKCPKCGKDVSSDQWYCEHCGETLD